MSVLPVGFGSSSGVDTGDIGHSLRFRGVASSSLNRTFVAPTANTSWALNYWLKLGTLGTLRHLLGVGAGSMAGHISLSAGNALTFTDNAGNVVATSTPLLRDPTGHGQLFVRSNGTNIKGYWNGVEILSYVGTITTINSANVHWIGRRSAASADHFDGYMSRTCFVDNGGALTPSDFAYFNTEINEWVSKTQSAVKAVIDAGGTNSFMLDFDDGTSLTTLGYDKSSKGNNWTLNSFSLTAGTTYDWMLDVPGNSYAALNPIYPSAANITNGNLSSGTTAARGTLNSTLFDSQWFVTAGASAVTAGVIDDSGTTNTTSVTANKVYAFKMTTAGALSYKNVTDAGSWTSIATGLTGNRWPYSVTQAASWNFGQQPLPEALDTGFKALCQANMPTPAILNPEQHHNVYTVTKSGNTNFTLDWDGSVYDTYFEIKRRDVAGDWYNVDGLRGYDKILKSNSTAAETTDANVIGVSGTTCTLKSTLADGTYVISAWKAGLTASRQTNTDGSITSTVSRNVTSGFAIVAFTSPASGNFSIGHGLGKAPKEVIVKNRAGTGGWTTFFKGATSIDSYLALNLTNAVTSSAGIWGGAEPSSTVVSMQSAVAIAASSAGVAYVHAEIPGYSKFGSYAGNGSVDGAYADLGFKPKWFRVKSSTAADDWRVYDALRPGYNVQGGDLRANTTVAEATAAEIDLTSSAVKLRIATTPNAAQTYVYSAYADVPTKYSLAR